MQNSKKVDDLYSSIITAGTHLVSSIKVAEASKVIENMQREVNIDFINELALIFDMMCIDTTNVPVLIDIKVVVENPTRRL